MVSRHIPALHRLHLDAGQLVNQPPIPQNLQGVPPRPPRPDAVPHRRPDLRLRLLLQCRRLVHPHHQIGGARLLRHLLVFPWRDLPSQGMALDPLHSLRLLLSRSDRSVLQFGRPLGDHDQQLRLRAQEHLEPVEFQRNRRD
ncbi:unnamed protein product [Linum tenue]|uniref:Uncharacterized protein n=1 Tax=Linum tenue TaxID=586396 RepID=A0AAV0HIK3_9ROSI|nr:unnamed protein product [Linum tenue]